MRQQIIKEFRERQLTQLIEEVRTCADRVAFIPMLQGDERPPLEEVHASFVTLARRSGYSVRHMYDQSPHDAVILTDTFGRTSLWVDRHLPQKRCREAFLQFLNQHSNAPAIDALGSRFHVDHAFNKARVTNASSEIGNDAAVNGAPISAGYLRLYLIEGSINTSYGAAIEKLRSNERLALNGFRMASWMVLLKLSETVRPSSDEDFDLAVKKLEQLFGEFAFQTDQDFCDALKSEMRLLKDRSTLVSGGQVISVGREEFTEMLDRHWFQRSRLARLVHEYFGWTIYNLARPDGSGEEFGVRIGDTERYYVADIPPRVVHSPVVLRRSQENHIAASDGIMADVDDPTIYTRLILLCNDEVARAIKADVAWYGRVLDILSGENLLKQEELELGRYRPGHQ